MRVRLSICHTVIHFLMSDLLLAAHLCISSVRINPFGLNNSLHLVAGVRLGLIIICRIATVMLQCIDDFSEAKSVRGRKCGAWFVSPGRPASRVQIAGY